MATTTIDADELRRRADRLDDAARQTPDDYLAAQLAKRAERMRQQANGGTPIERLREALDR